MRHRRWTGAIGTAATRKMPDEILVGATQVATLMHGLPQRRSHHTLADDAWRMPSLRSIATMIA